MFYLSYFIRCQMVAQNIFPSYTYITIQSIPQKMAEAIKEIRRMSKTLQETFKLVTYYTSKHLAKSKKYGNEYMQEYTRIAKKMQKDYSKDISKENKKFKTERDQLKEELAKLKSLRAKRERDQKQRKQDKQTSKSFTSSQEKSKERQKTEKDRRTDRYIDKNEDRGKQRDINRDRQREKLRARERQRQRERFEREDQKDRYKKKQRQRLRQRQRQREKQKKYGQIEQIEFKNKKDIMSEKRIDKEQGRVERQSDKRQELSMNFSRDFDLNKPFKPNPNGDNTIFYEEESRNQPLKNLNPIAKPRIKKWSYKKPDNICCTNPQKYKILVVDEENSDFEDENALIKVPQIKPRQPLTPYFLFLRANKFAISKSFPNVNSKRGYAKVWQDLPEQQKKPFIDEYNRAQKIYSNKMNQYYSIHPRKQNEEVEDQEQKKEKEGEKQKKKKKEKGSSKKQKQGQKFKSNKQKSSKRKDKKD